MEATPQKDVVCILIWTSLVNGESVTTLYHTVRASQYHSLSTVDVPVSSVQTWPQFNAV